MSYRKNDRALALVYATGNAMASIRVDPWYGPDDPGGSIIPRILSVPVRRLVNRAGADYPELANALEHVLAASTRRQARARTRKVDGVVRRIYVALKESEGK